MAVNEKQQLRARRLPLFVMLLLSIGCRGISEARAATPSMTSEPTRPPQRPTICRDVAAGSALQQVLDAVQPGDALCLSPGLYAGPLTISKPVQLWGARGAVIRSTGQGTTVLVTAAGTTLEGFTIDGSGGRFDTLDAALKLHADDVVADGLRIQGATFGILSEQARRVKILHCDVVGNGEPSLGMRGDSIRLWETRDSLVEGNHVEQGRDVVVWYSSNNRLIHNTMQGGRYGAHLMYSHQNVVEDNRFLGNVVGVFLMYSRNVTLERNLIVDSSGAAGIGVGMKESGNITLRGNQLLHNTIGIYLDTSPLQIEDQDLFERNTFRFGQAGVVFHSSEQRNTFRDNDFSDNQAQVQVEGGGDALDVTWEGNHFDDYAGYDLDRDGFGDLPYELHSLSGDLTSKHPDLLFFNGAPALALMDAVGQTLPLLAPKTILRDSRPRMAVLKTEVSDAR